MTCAHVVNVTMKKIPGVESVEVSLNQGSAKLKLKPGNTVPIEQLWAAIQKNGFTTKGTRVVVRGEVISSDGKLQLKVPGPGVTYELAGGEQLKSSAGKTVVVEGTMTPVKGKKAAVPIHVTAVKAGTP
jgi:copper chaperone CopZ